MSAPRKKLTRKRLNNALAQVYHEHPSYFFTPPTKMSFFEHVHAGNLDDVQEFLEETDFNINMLDKDGNGCLFYAMDGAGGLPMVKLLLDNGANINMMNYVGEVPIHVLCRDLASLHQNQIEILAYLLEQETLILFPFQGQSLETIFSYAYNDIRAFQLWYDEALNDQENEPISAENRNKAVREEAIQGDIWRFYLRISELSELYVKYVNLVPNNATERSYHYIDIRMTGLQLKHYIQRQIYRNPSMNIDLLYRGHLLDLFQTLSEQGLQSADDETTITYQVRLVSGVMARRGGKRKTQRRLRKR